MHPVAEKLLDQHVAFELEALTGDGLQPFLRSELQRAFALGEALTLSDFATRKRCVAAFKRLLVRAKFPESARSLVVSSILSLARRHAATDVELEAIIGRDRLIELVDLAAGLHEPRRRLVREMLQHPLYSDLISNLVYQALVNYLMEDNLFSQRVPGVGSMLKLGRSVASRAVPGLDARLERQLKGYIKGYLPSLIKTSEQFLEGVVTDETLGEQLAEAWPEIGSRQLAGLFEGLEADDAERIGEWGQRYWDELRQSAYFTDMGETLIGHVFEHYGDEPLSMLLDDLGITRTLVSKELLAFAPPLLKQLRKSGYLGDFLRDRLEPFYASEAVVQILEKGS